MKSTDLTNDIPSEIHNISHLIDQGEYDKALTEMRQYTDKNPNSKMVDFFKSSIFVDVGFRIHDSALVGQGIEAGESLLAEQKCDDYRIPLQYNLSNAYISLYYLVEWKIERNAPPSAESAPKSENLQAAKAYLRKVIFSAKKLDRDFYRQAWVNYGNCLDTLGRSVEAFVAYDMALKYDNHFSMAIGNKAKASIVFANISGKYSKSIYAMAYQAIKSIIDDPELIKTGGPDAKIKFDNQLRAIEDRFKNEQELLSKKIIHPPYDMTGLSNFEKYYINFCRKERLFLNFHIHDDQCEAALYDPIFIKILLDNNAKKPLAEPYKFVKYINQIKEDFMTARLLLVQSQYRRDDFDNISQITTLVYCLDYSKFNLYIGLLKSAFKEAFNILDKVAVFINDYYCLGLDEDQISFISSNDAKCVWQKGGLIREKILASKNMSLYAIYDIFLDFKSGYYKNIRTIRNSLTHRKLVVFDSSTLHREIEDSKHEITQEDLLQKTIELLRLVKAAIIYLINFVNLEEEKKAGPRTYDHKIPFDINQIF